MKDGTERLCTTETNTLVQLLYKMAFMYRQ